MSIGGFLALAAIGVVFGLLFSFVPKDKEHQYDPMKNLTEADWNNKVE